MSKHSIQHFVAKSYLEPWCDADYPASPKLTPFVWLFDKDGSKSRRKAPKNIFWETDMYTSHQGGERDLRLEHLLWRLEDAYVRLLRKTLAAGEPLTDAEHRLLCMYIAAAHARTPRRREHWRGQWERPLEMMDELAARMKDATVEQKRAMGRIPSLSNGPTFSHEQVRAIVAQPMQSLLVPEIRTIGPLLAKLDFAVLQTDDEVGFITSDHPCVWYDAESYKRAPLYRAPALMYETIEITFPISPSQCILLNRIGLEGYCKAGSLALDTINRRTRFMADEHFVIRKNKTNPVWFEEQEEPEDSWDKTHGQQVA
jgi:hypothetical protein